MVGFKAVAKMLSWRLLFLTIVLCAAFSSGSPLRRADLDLESARRGEVFEINEKLSKEPIRSGRQGFYDYFSNPYEYYKAPNYPDYSSYYGSYFDSPTYNQNPYVNRPAPKVSRKKYDQRRKQFEASTQRWTVWDLARK